ncbi:hypothetical protein [Phenylobacterium sp.]|uniref:hypothetical protein n=1 Tax=Phenylobacterium sp. TaxID=1871053 RepID=UPI0011F86067|nr:hypothetical protein [Phenylobacterium sp.]THD54138.1 MAG: hypothetical protein E8A12_17685 [Phenylobacterium sp.]
MGREQVTAVLVLGIVAAFLGYTLMTRLHEGRCRPGGRRGGIDCTYAAPVDRPSSDPGSFRP